MIQIPHSSGDGGDHAEEVIDQIIFGAEVEVVGTVEVMAPSTGKVAAIENVGTSGTPFS